MAKKRVVLRVWVSIEYETQEQFWERLSRAHKAMGNMEISKGVRILDGSTHDIPNLDFSEVE